mmetsp:Transcript_22126/g.41975  ORF Transcript_22126/g.41975 Transcript_22126/m.41975 type:complete len:274 (-) Transcript_22126:1051-1872(-)
MERKYCQARQAGNSFAKVSEQATAIETQVNKIGHSINEGGEIGLVKVVATQSKHLETFHSREIRDGTRQFTVFNVQNLQIHQVGVRFGDWSFKFVVAEVQDQKVDHRTDDGVEGAVHFISHDIQNHEASHVSYGVGDASSQLVPEEPENFEVDHLTKLGRETTRDFVVSNRESSQIFQGRNAVQRSRKLVIVNHDHSETGKRQKDANISREFVSTRKEDRETRHTGEIRQLALEHVVVDIEFLKIGHGEQGTRDGAHDVVVGQGESTQAIQAS